MAAFLKIKLLKIQLTVTKYVNIVASHIYLTLIVKREQVFTIDSIQSTGYAFKSYPYSRYIPRS